jgi:hypothetical protein
MITAEHGILEFSDPESVNALPEFQFAKVRYEEKLGNLKFWMRDDLDDNQEKTIYKVGFLYKFLRALYPDKVQREIYEIMDERYHIFLGPRQIKRNVKAFEEMNKFNDKEIGM